MEAAYNPCCARLLSAVPHSTLAGKRDAAMIGWLLGCGLRRSEVVTLRLDQLQSRDGHCVIVDLPGKGWAAPNGTCSGLV